MKTKFFVVNPERNKLLRKPSCRLENNIRVDLGNTACGDLDEIHVASTSFLLIKFQEKYCPKFCRGGLVLLILMPGRKGFGTPFRLSSF
jgi:hypothetical protein